MDQPWLSLDLPVGWEMKFDPGQKRYFFLDHINKSTAWEDPRIKLWHERQRSIKNTVAPAIHEDPFLENLMSRFPSARKETISLVLKSSKGDIDEAAEMLKDMGYQEKKLVLASDNLFKTLSLLSRPDTLSPKSSSSAPANPARPSSARSSSPVVSSSRKTKACYSETNSTISNSSEEDKKKNDKRNKSHKHGQAKKRSDKDKRETHPEDFKVEPIAPSPLIRSKQNEISKDQNNQNNQPVKSSHGITESNSNHQEHCVSNFVSLSLGPNKSLVKGPDPSLRSGRSPTPRGHDSSLCSGPSPTNVCGPQKELLKGPQACLLSGDSI